MRSGLQACAPIQSQFLSIMFYVWILPVKAKAFNMQTYAIDFKVCS